jgi:hypothetical protein
MHEFSNNSDKKSKHPTKSEEVLMSHCGQEKELRDVRKAMLKFISRNIP